MDYLSVTNQYYSKWLGNESILNHDFCGVQFLYSSNRNQTQRGYAEKFDLYIYAQSDRTIVSYGDNVFEKIDEIKKQITLVVSVNRLKEILTQIFGECPAHNIKYVFEEIPEKIGKARPLTFSEYPQYHDFFIKMNPDCKDTTWLKEYFMDMVKAHLCCGRFSDGILASCSDAPEMPYMSDNVQEIGVNTLEFYRGRGYAADVCIACAKEIIKNEKCPQWSTSWDNIASQKTALKTGFRKMADILTLTI